jgi:hypothetical protein
LWAFWRAEDGAIANAELGLKDENGNPVSDAQFFAVAGANKLVQIPQTNGTPDLSQLAGLENIINKPIPVIVYRCDQDPKTRVYFLLPGQTAPENKDNCKEWTVALIVFDGSNWFIKEGPQAGSRYHFTGPMAPTPTTQFGEGPSDFNVVGFFDAGAVKALNFERSICSSSGSTSSSSVECHTSNTALGLNGGVKLCFWVPCLVGGFFKGNNVSATSTFTSSTFTGTATLQAKFHAAQFGGTLPLASVVIGGGRELFLEANGGVAPYTVYETITSSSATTTAGAGVRLASSIAASSDPTSTLGGTGHYWGGTAGFAITRHIGASFNYTRLILPHASTSQTVDMYAGGIMVFIAPQKTLFKIGQK